MDVSKKFFERVLTWYGGIAGDVETINNVVETAGVQFGPILIENHMTVAFRRIFLRRR
jgi:hypothetical protein